MIETLSEGNPRDAPYSSKGINSSNRTILPTCKVNDNNENDILRHNPYEILYVEILVIRK